MGLSQQQSTSTTRHRFYQWGAHHSPPCSLPRGRGKTNLWTALWSSFVQTPAGPCGVTSALRPLSHSESSSLEHLLNVCFYKAARCGIASALRPFSHWESSSLHIVSMCFYEVTRCGITSVLRPFSRSDSSTVHLNVWR